MSAALRLALVFGWTIGSLCESDVPATHTVYDKLSIQRNRSKRELQCGEEEYEVENICCKKCAPGTFKQADCTKVNNTTCISCEKGSFMDHNNSYNKCRRCQTCDTTFGLEVAEPCTATQNIKCKCAQDHFCNSAPCAHCDPCDKCENGAIEKACTSTTNTICKSNVWWISLVVGVGIIIAITSLSVISVYCYKKRRQDFDLNMPKLDQVVRKQHCSVEMEPLMYTDVDLSTHVPNIVEEMTLPQVKSFVRKYEIPEPAIEQILQDHLHDSTEQKIKLFHFWYQTHGMKGAYGNLIRSLRELKMCAVADKIEKKMYMVTSSTQENGKSNVKTAEQSSAHFD